MSNSLFRQLLAPAGVFPGKTTKESDLRSLVHAMRVSPTAHKLMRVGPAGDGGYLIPDDLNGIDYCFSPGVAGCSEFELQLAEQNIQIFLADRSVERPPIEHKRFNFQKKFIAATNSSVDNLMTLDSWYTSMVQLPKKDSPEAILQMDIESSEYEVIHNVTETLLNRFRIIIIEFHKLHQLADRFAFRLMAPALRKLLISHAVVHIHPNNHRKPLSVHGITIPANMEVTFLRRDRLQSTNEPLSFPHQLDYRCDKTKPELILPECWYK